MCSVLISTVFADGRVEHQKLNQTTTLLLFGWVFGVQLGSLEKKWLAKNFKPWRVWRNIWTAPNQKDLDFGKKRHKDKNHIVT